MWGYPVALGTMVLIDLYLIYPVQEGRMVLDLPRVVACACLLALPTGAALAADLKPATVAAFDRYVRIAEARMATEVADPRRFLIIDTDTEAARKARLAELRAGRISIERLAAREGGKTIDIPDGLVHHWVGIIFVPGGTAATAVALLRDYERHDEVYKPAVQRSAVLSQDGDSLRVFLRFFMKKVLAVTLNTDHDARFTTISPAPRLQPDCQHAHSGSGRRRHRRRARVAGRARWRLPVAHQQLLALRRARRRRLHPV